MVNPKFNTDNLVRQLVPIHKRQPVRLSLLRGLLGPLRELFESFDTWRNHTRMMVNVNSQVRILEEYLRQKYGDRRIRILNYTDGLPAICLEIEGETLMAEVGLLEPNWIELPLVGEMDALFDGSDFLVYVPAALDLDLIRAEIEAYKQVLITYKIILI